MEVVAAIGHGYGLIVKNRWKARGLILFVVIAACIMLAVVFYWRFRSPESVETLLRRLPQKNAVVVQLDVKMLRAAGLLELVASSPVVEEEDYRRFVHETTFDYRSDLDLALVSFEGEDILALLTGRFDLAALKNYALVHGGKCQNGVCSLPASRPNRFISFAPLRTNLIGWANSTDENAALRMFRSADVNQLPQVPAGPVWVSVPSSVWKKSNTPSGTKLFAKALEDADYSMFSISLGVNAKAEASLQAFCKNDAAALSLHNQLQGVTEVFRKYMERADQHPQPGDLGLVLTQGMFERTANRVMGKWPLDRAFLEALAGGRL